MFPILVAASTALLLTRLLLRANRWNWAWKPIMEEPGFIMAQILAVLLSLSLQSELSASAFVFALLFTELAWTVSTLLDMIGVAITARVLEGPGRRR